MPALGTYSVLFVKPSGKMFFELIQAPSKAEATKVIMGSKQYADCEHIETRTKVMSEGEANKAAATQEAKVLKAKKAAIDALEKERAKSQAKKKAQKKASK